MRVGVLAPESSWHFQDLKRAAIARGDVELISVDFVSLGAVYLSDSSVFFDRHQAIQSLDALVVRTMPHGSLQQVVFRMDLLHRLSAAGLSVVNPPRSVEIAIDKFLSLSLMSEAGISVPPFGVCQTVEQGKQLFERLGGDVVLKPIFGSMGKNIHRMRDLNSLTIQMRKFIEHGEVIYLQKFVEHDGIDFRVFVCGEDVFCMRRKSVGDGWITNIAQGGSAEAWTPTDKEKRVAILAAKINQCEIAGVDLVYSKSDSEPYVLEVNAAPGWEALQRVSAVDIGARVLSRVMN